jgi:hypothetical protein
VSAVRHRLGEPVLRAINRISALALGGFGLWQLGRVLSG